LEASNSKKVAVEDRLDGALHIISKGVALKYKEISERPRQEVPATTDLRIYNRPPKPSKDHPWKRRWQTLNTPPLKEAYSYQTK
jgi:hypothetical protein